MISKTLRNKKEMQAEYLLKKRINKRSKNNLNKVRGVQLKTKPRIHSNRISNNQASHNSLLRQSKRIMDKLELLLVVVLAAILIQITQTY